MQMQIQSDNFILLYLLDFILFPQNCIYAVYILYILIMQYMFYTLKSI